MSPSALERLPYELKLAILFQQRDFASLASIILASRTFYEVFQNNKERILQTLLQRDMVHHELLVDAAAVANYAPMFLEQSIRRAKGIEASRPPYPTLCFSKLCDDYRYVKSFSEAFCRDLLRENPRTGETDTDPIPPSKGELFRIQSAFYRVWLFSTMIDVCARGGGVFSVRLAASVASGEEKPSLKNLVLSNIIAFTWEVSLWEVEEIQIILDYLYRRVRPLCEYFMASGQPEMESFRATWRETHPDHADHPGHEDHRDSDLINAWTYYLTSLSLPVIYRLIFTMTSDERRGRLLDV
ncbi:hypothetical protein K440DRAFT_215436 [Wilcoxina mikolae CBS 423.85]|nr:hypothetical protein K440DRAFT_215436 [Wilcoxina mikolae CBS 423.85]